MRHFIILRYGHFIGVKSVKPVDVLPVDFCCFFSGTDIHVSRQAMYVKLNFAALSRHQCCRVKAIIVIYSEYVTVASVIRHEMRMRRIILSGSTI
jgi:hypothetical protein